MDAKQFDAILARTLDDQRLSRSERDALEQVLEDDPPSAHELAVLRSRVFTAAAERLVDPRDRAILEWCADLVKTLHRPTETAGRRTTEVATAFSPGDDCTQKITGLIQSARGKIDICVFTITDDRIARAIEVAHQRRVAIRIITDDDKTQDRGSDIVRLADAGVPIRVDRSPYHMHHKFAVFDDRTLLTGSFNWTRSAAANNAEHIITTNDTRLVEALSGHFAKLWDELG